PVTGSGANPNAMGSGVCRSTTEEVEPQEPVVRSRSPWCPSSAAQLPEPGRWSPLVAHHPSRTVHAFFLFARGWGSSPRSAVQEAFQIERHLLAPQVIPRSAQLGFQDRQCLALALLLLLPLHPALHRRHRPNHEARRLAEGPLEMG